MDTKKRFPALAELDSDEIRRLLKRSTLSRADRQIAASCLCWGMCDADIAVAVHMDRSTVGRRLREKIVPQLAGLMHKDQKHCAGG